MDKFYKTQKTCIDCGKEFIGKSLLRNGAMRIRCLDCWEKNRKAINKKSKEKIKSNLK